MRCFRDKGFDETTMRDIAREAEVSLGNAYHYFPSKNAIVAAYYDVQQDRHEKLALGRMAEVTDLRERLGIAFHTKIDAVRKDRRLLIAVSRSLADPSDPLSAFSEESRAVRERAIGIFEAALDVPVVLPERRRLLATTLWGLHLASLAYLVRDESRGQRKTRA
ncbi:MAG: helix-turn-helix transcriptional regulator, partial [Myxococcales bacterium]|nr:helix-turn-helix transcriptional regulator [Myxococcales bacterium]